jgi:hypothetical protein
LGVAVWCTIVDSPPFAAVASALGRVLGAEVAAAYEGGPWGFHDSEELARLVNDSGFTNVNVRSLELPFTLEGGTEQLFLTLRASPAASAVAELSEEDQLALARAVKEAARPITYDGIVRSHATSLILTAQVDDGRG